MEIVSTGKRCWLTLCFPVNQHYKTAPYLLGMYFTSTMACCSWEFLNRYVFNMPLANIRRGYRFRHSHSPSVLSASTWRARSYIRLSWTYSSGHSFSKIVLPSMLSPIDWINIGVEVFIFWLLFSNKVVGSKQNSLAHCCSGRCCSCCYQRECQHSLQGSCPSERCLRSLAFVLPCLSQRADA